VAAVTKQARTREASVAKTGGTSCFAFIKLCIFICVRYRAAALLNQRPPPSFLPIIEHRRIAACFPGDYKFASPPVQLVQENDFIAIR
jgi:hypothetical protein